jgi:hypothetical protein
MTWDLSFPSFPASDDDDDPIDSHHEHHRRLLWCSYNAFYLVIATALSMRLSLLASRCR